MMWDKLQRKVQTLLQYEDHHNYWLSIVEVTISDLGQSQLCWENAGNTQGGSYIRYPKLSDCDENFYGQDMVHLYNNGKWNVSV